LWGERAKEREETIKKKKKKKGRSRSVDVRARFCGKEVWKKRRREGGPPDILHAGSGLACLGKRGKEKKLRKKRKKGEGGSPLCIIDGGGAQAKGGEKKKLKKKKKKEVWLRCFLMFLPSNRKARPERRGRRKKT